MKHYVLWDEDGRNHRCYGVRSWPAALLIGRDGRVIWEGRPSKVLDPCGGGQTVVDKTIGAVLERLVEQALEQPFQGEVARR